MTVSEVRFNETVPNFLRRIAEATEKIAAERKRANQLTAIQIIMDLKKSGNYSIHDVAHIRQMLATAMDGEATVDPADLAKGGDD